MFKTNNNKGFWVTFENGYSLSTQFGHGNYCENWNKDDGKYTTECEDSEIAIICPSGDSMDLNNCFEELFGEELNDSVCGRIKIDKWFKILEYVKNIKE